MTTEPAAPYRAVRQNVRLFGGICANELHTGVNKRRVESLQTSEVFGPDALVNAVAEVSSLFGQDALLALGAFVFGEATLRVLDDARVLHGDERVAATCGVEAHMREAWVGLG